MARMAVLVDGAFYLKRARKLMGSKSPQARAEELTNYCHRHTKHEEASLYRIFYYDCDPLNKKVFHPLHNRTYDLGKTPEYSWKIDFFEALGKRRKVALRKGQALESTCQYVLKPEASKAIVTGRRDVSSLTDADFVLDVQQKGVDMRIGLDVALLADRGFVDQIVLVAGDSDFVPAAKYARRNGVDFILDPMWHSIRPDLSVHVDGLYTPCKRPTKS